MWFARIIALCFISIAAYHIRENPEGISILIGLLTILLFLVKTEQGVLFRRHLVLQRNYLLDLVPIKRKFQISDIKKLEISGNRDLKRDIWLDLLPYYLSPELKNKIHIELTNGKSKTYKTFIYLNELEKLKDKFYQIKRQNKPAHNN